jgi:hypothetical protein
VAGQGHMLCALVHTDSSMLLLLLLLLLQVDRM